mmetsp:Transcript_32558/g.56346  ORF Transcript_32558/g.56346 Transcript_32558/m.56346 type:complete len:127 (-) Transcript_32558:2986-3366(-)
MSQLRVEVSIIMSPFKLLAALSVSLMPVYLYANVMGFDAAKHLWVLVATVAALTCVLSWIYEKISSIYYEKELLRIERLLNQSSANYRLQLLDESNTFAIGLTNAVFLISLSIVLLLGPTALSLEK